ncbi:MAG: hypothetical protein ACRDKZ_01140, partial [Actinomycetota bacterium]
QTQSRASDSVRDALDLYAARLEVAQAQKALGGSDLDDAVDAAGDANRIARRVGRLTRRIVATLVPAGRTARSTVGLARRGTQVVVATRRQSAIATGSLGAISGYQRAASRSNKVTNRALQRILVALRRTNEEFGP